MCALDFVRRAGERAPMPDALLAPLAPRRDRGATRPTFADTREPTITLAHALVLGQIITAGGAVAASRIGDGARVDLRTFADRGWAVLSPAAGERLETWTLTPAAYDVWAQVGGERPVVMPDREVVRHG